MAPPPKHTKQWIPKPKDKSTCTLLPFLKVKQTTMDGIQANVSQSPNQATSVIPINGVASCWWTSAEFFFSSVMNGRAFCLLELHGMRFQFGRTPTLSWQDGLFTFQTLLNAHKNHNLLSFVAFVDLANAYDTANHDLLLEVLKKYWAPPKFVAAIKTMYTDLKVVLKIDKKIQEILQSVGVWQGFSIPHACIGQNTQVCMETGRHWGTDCGPHSR